MPSAFYLVFSLLNSLLCVFVGWLLNSHSLKKRNNQEDIENNIKKISLLSHKLLRAPRVLLAICGHHKISISEEGITPEKEYINAILYGHIDSLIEIFTLKLKNYDLPLELKNLEHYIDFSYRLAKIGRIEKPKAVSIEKTSKKNYYKNILKDFSMHNNNFMTYNEALRIFIKFLINDMDEFIDSIDLKEKSYRKKFSEKLTNYAKSIKDFFSQCKKYIPVKK